MIYFINFSEARQIKIKKIIGCEIGSLPRSYLGLPLGLTPPNSFWNSLIDKIHSKLVGWKCSLLSQARKVIVLNSILKSVPLYALSVLKILRKFSLAIEKIQKTFLWTGVENQKRLPLIAWENVCMPFEKGGLGLRRITTMNKFLLAKLLWRWHKEEGEWKNIWVDKYNRDNYEINHFLNIDLEQGGSMMLKNAQKFKNIIRKGVKWKGGNGRTVPFWENTQILDHPLCDDLRWNKYMEQCKNQIGTFVANYWKDDMWVDLNSVDHNLVELSKCLDLFF